MEKAKISGQQLFVLMFMFNMGTAVVVAYGIGAKKDAWLAILFGMFIAIALFFIYYRLFLYYPKLPLTGYARKIVGRYLGWVIGFLYILYFMHIATRQVRDFSELLVSSTMTETPLLTIIITFVLVVCYVLYQGMEVLARTAEVFIVILFLFGILANFFILISGNLDFHNLRPFLENGWKPILTTTFLETIHFPYGEMVVFTMILPYLKHSGSVKKTWLSALMISGLILSWTATLNLAVLGVEVIERSTFPTLTTIGKVNILEFIQRLDALVVLSMFMTVFFKGAIFMYGAVIGIVDLFKLKNHQQVIFPVGGIIIISAMIIAPNFSAYMEEARKSLRFIVYLFFLIFPLMMLVIAAIQKRYK
ncbi:GerAB/ArcD/ProY family transporter [Mesobacillus foraminis]|uniref:GerAB/ArcD/ProY family transporter n=1 Tax=Mesobacillus foraminis TaxID=279826 RepID=UPI0039A13ADE